MINLNDPEFNKFYMGNSHPDIYKSENIKYVAYPKLASYRSYNVVSVVSSSKPTIETFYSFDEVLKKHPEARQTRQDVYSWKNDKNVWFHLTVETDTDGFNQDKEAYEQFQQKLGDHFNNFLKSELMPSCLMNKNNEIFNTILSKAWEERHSDGYYEVATKFKDLCDFAVSILDHV